MNALAKARSPYLLEHSNDPINWEMLSRQTLTKATQDNKLLFISIGYLACHWCHVMHEESFKDPIIAQILNKDFISIKIDREERPDIDRKYIRVCQLVNGHAGWPLTIVAFPDLRPIYINTYLSKDGSTGRYSLMSLLSEISRELVQNKNNLYQRAKSIAQLEHTMENKIKKQECQFGEKDILSSIETAYNHLSQIADYDYGGFGSNMKFPMPNYLNFLLGYYHTKKDPNALFIVVNTLNALRKSSTYDQVNFGIHRYSTDRYWFIPHFEKMLYDQALMGNIYLQAYLASKNLNFLNTAKEIAIFLFNHLYSKNGGFYAAIDADKDGIEGLCYTPTYDFLKNILNEKELEIICLRFGITKEGNYNNAHMLRNGNLLYSAYTIKQISKKTGITSINVEHTIRSANIKIRKQSSKLSHKIDDKILTDQNGLTLNFLSNLYIITKEEAYLNKALQLAEFMLTKIYDGTNVYHVYKEGAYIDGFLDDYSFFVYGLLELYTASLDQKYLTFAIEINKLMIHKFFDSDKITLHLTQEKDSPESYVDNAYPSGGSVAILNLIRISRLTGDNENETIAQSLLPTENILKYPTSHIFLLNALFYYTTNTYEFVIKAYNEKKAKEILNEITNYFIPYKTILYADSNSQKIAPFTTNMFLKGVQCLYICRNHSCNLPISNIREIKKALKNI